MHNIYYLESDKYGSFFRRLIGDFKFFGTSARLAEGKETEYAYKRFSADEPVVFNPYRAQEPLKSFFTPASEKVSAYFGDKTVEEVEKAVVFGVKSCDLAGHKVQDFVFLEGVDADGIYSARRENTILIASDCTDFKEVCHCLAWDILPYPTEGFDLNLSPLNDGYLVEAGSKKGEELIAKYAEYFIPAKDVQLAARQAKRESFIQRLRRHLLPQNLVDKNSVQKIVKGGYAAGTWQDFMLPCVECGGCNLICDTCHCFLLSDKEILVRLNSDRSRVSLPSAER